MSYYLQQLHNSCLTKKKDFESVMPTIKTKLVSNYTYIDNLIRMMCTIMVQEINNAIRKYAIKKSSIIHN